MAELTWRPQAIRDLEAIEAYYEEFSPHHARLLVERIFERSRQLEQFPRSGRVVPEIGKERVREIFYRTYRLIYEVSEDLNHVDVLTVVHSSRSFEHLPNKID